jgi:hypothetical protein
MIVLTWTWRLVLLGVILLGASLVYAVEFSGWHNLKVVTMDSDSVVNWQSKLKLREDRPIVRQPLQEVAGRLLRDAGTARVDISYGFPNKLHIERNRFRVMAYVVDARSGKLFGLDEVGHAIPAAGSGHTWEHPVITGTRTTGLFRFCTDFRVRLLMPELRQLADGNLDLYRLIEEINLTHDEYTLVRVAGLPYVLKVRAEDFCGQMSDFIRFIEDYRPDMNRATELDLRYDNLIVQMNEAEKEAPKAAPTATRNEATEENNHGR